MLVLGSLSLIPVCLGYLVDFDNHGIGWFENIFSRDFNIGLLFDKFCSLKMSDLLHFSVILRVTITVLSPGIEGTSSGPEIKKVGRLT